MQLILKVGRQKSATILAETLKKHNNFIDEFYEIDKQTVSSRIKKKESFGNLTSKNNEDKVIVVIGGDGFMLSQLRKDLVDDSKIPHYGINVGCSGFLLNSSKPKDLLARIKKAQSIQLPILHVKAYTNKHNYTNDFAINEVTLLRMSPQSAHLGIQVDNINRISKLVSDGLIVSTPAGSTGYNSSLQGPILPLESKIWTLTPISPFRPRRWRGALLSQTSDIVITVNQTSKRPVSATVDNKSIGEVTCVKVSLATDKSVRLLFDSDANLNERIIKEQFSA